LPRLLKVVRIDVVLVELPRIWYSSRPQLFVPELESADSALKPSWEERDDGIGARRERLALVALFPVHLPVGLDAAFYDSEPYAGRARDNLVEVLGRIVGSLDAPQGSLLRRRFERLVRLLKRQTRRGECALGSALSFFRRSGESRFDEIKETSLEGFALGVVDFGE